MKTIKAKVTKDLSDYQLVEAAERLINYRPKADLPRNYSLMDLYRAEEKLMEIANEFLEKYGSRLRDLAPELHRTISNWKL